MNKQEIFSLIDDHITDLDCRAQSVQELLDQPGDFDGQRSLLLLEKKNTYLHAKSLAEDLCVRVAAEMFS